MYRIRPSVTHEPFHPLDFAAEALTADFTHAPLTPNQMRWRPFAIPADPVDWVRGLFTVAGAGGAGTRDGYAIHVYAASADMAAKLKEAGVEHELITLEGAGHMLVGGKPGDYGQATRRAVEFIKAHTN